MAKIFNEIREIPSIKIKINSFESDEYVHISKVLMFGFDLQRIEVDTGMVWCLLKLGIEIWVFYVDEIHHISYTLKRL